MPISRKKSCQQCRVAKARCSLERICQRCLERGFHCEYVAGTSRWDPYGSVNLSSSGLDMAWPPPSATQTQISSLLSGLAPEDLEVPYEFLGNSLVGQNHGGANGQPGQYFAGSTGSSEAIGQQPERSREAAVMPPPSSSDFPFPWLDSSPSLLDLPLKMGPSSLALCDDPVLSSKVVPTPLSAELRADSQDDEEITVLYGRSYERYLRRRKQTTLERALMVKVLMGQIEDFPRRLIEGGRLPPFIHPQCVLEDRLPRECIAKNGAHTCLPEPLAICASLAQLFFNRNGGSSQYVWKLIYAELKRLHTEHAQYDGRTLLASVQAMAIYMLLQAKDSETIAQNDIGHMTIMLTEVSKMLHNHPDTKAYVEDIYKLQHLNHKTWVLYESLRRTTNLYRVLGAVLNVLIGIPNLPDCGTIQQVPLLCVSYLWDTDTTESWAERLHRYQSRRACADRELTIGDLSRVLRSSTNPNGSASTGYGPGGNNGSDDALSDPLLQKDLATWCENLDEIGTLVWMATMLDRDASS
ncbi:hypothetical protein F5Y16DRAFT_275577 [Xylariaceae sp. FL0255]|nr:hypothetical protein F5Y16DRAFT_275577 [Xylariaceae sp. FL0255]